MRNPKVFMLLAGIALVGGAVGSYFQWSSLQERTAKADGLRKQMRDEGDIRKQLAESAARLEETASQLAHLEKGVPQYAYLATMLSELDKTGRESGIEVLGVRPIVQNTPLTANPGAGGEAKARKPYEELNIEVKGRGNYRAVMEFVQALQKFPKIVAARTISLTPKLESDSSQSGRLDVVIEIRAFLFPPAQTDRGLRAEGPSTEVTTNNG